MMDFIKTLAPLLCFGARGKTLPMLTLILVAALSIQLLTELSEGRGGGALKGEFLLKKADILLLYEEFEPRDFFETSLTLSMLLLSKVSVRELGALLFSA